MLKLKDILEKKYLERQRQKELRQEMNRIRQQEAVRVRAVLDELVDAAWQQKAVDEHGGRFFYWLNGNSRSHNNDKFDPVFVKEYFKENGWDCEYDYRRESDTQEEFYGSHTYVTITHSFDIRPLE